MREDVAKPIYSITPFTLLDYPHKTACILWFAGCNMRCLYCYNPDIVLGKGKLSFQEALKFLKTRINLLDGVVLSGGECTLHKNIINLIIEIKKMGLLIKVDTNGTNPDMIEFLLKEKLIDYVALDFKALKNNYYDITKSTLFNKFKEALNLLNQSTIPFEVRTTIHADLLNMEDIQQMIKFLESQHYRGKYYLQNYVNAVNTLGGINNSKTKFGYSEQLKSNIEVIIRN